MTEYAKARAGAGHLIHALPLGTKKAVCGLFPLARWMGYPRHVAVTCAKCKAVIAKGEACPS